MKLSTASQQARDAIGHKTGLNDLVAYCEKIASASGGILGIGKVSLTEAAVYTEPRCLCNLREESGS